MVAEVNFGNNDSHEHRRYKKFNT